MLTKTQGHSIEVVIPSHKRHTHTQTHVCTLCAYQKLIRVNRLKLSSSVTNLRLTLLARPAANWVYYPRCQLSWVKSLSRVKSFRLKKNNNSRFTVLFISFFLISSFYIHLERRFIKRWLPFVHSACINRADYNLNLENQHRRLPVHLGNCLLPPLPCRTHRLSSFSTVSRRCSTSHVAVRTRAALIKVIRTLGLHNAQKW